jgi:hypothetical protein
MKQEEPILEVEVVEIDGVAVEPSSEKSRPTDQSGRRVDWRKWQGQVRMLDRRWMPLWIALGVIAVVLFVVVGIVVVCFAIVYWILKSIIRTILSIFTPANHSLR